jgi:hypothetical protein
MADIIPSQASAPVTITGPDEQFQADVEPKATGENGLHVIASITDNPDGIDSFPYVKDYFIDSDRGDNTFNAEEVIYSYTGKGKFISWWAEMNNEKYRYKIFIDGQQRADVDMRIYKDAGVNKDNSALGGMDLYYEDGDKTMGHFPRFPIQFNASLEIRMQGTNGNTSIKSYVIALTKES